MIKSIGFILTMLVTSAIWSPSPVVTFKEEQLRYSRVRTAYSEKEGAVKSLFEKAGVDFPKCDILIRGFKKEKELQVWGKSKDSTKYRLIKKYEFCILSGLLGPKRKQGDRQVPEGFYYIDRFNPSSNFYLSLGINYPNSADRKKSSSSNLGGDIFIHGDCVTIGCVPITTSRIKELYLICVEAKSSGQSKIPVHIYPTKMTEYHWENLKSKYEDEPKLIAFWKNLKEGYDRFGKYKTVPAVGVSTSGDYTFK